MVKNRILQNIAFSLHKKFIFIFFSWLIFSYNVFSIENKAYLNQEHAVFKLHILKGDSFKILGNATYEQATQILKKIDVSMKSEFVITEHDIKKYNWLEQSIDLTLDKSMEMLKKYVSKNINSKDFLTRKYYWSDIEHALHTLAFLIMLEDKILYGGIFIQRATSLGSSYPVIYLQPGTEMTLKPFKLQIRLILRPLAPLFSLNSYMSTKPIIRQRIEITEIYNFFSKIGKLSH